jgi:hypothetical protein
VGAHAGVGAAGLEGYAEGFFRVGDACGKVGGSDDEVIEMGVEHKFVFKNQSGMMGTRMTRIPRIYTDFDPAYGVMH